MQFQGRVALVAGAAGGIGAGIAKRLARAGAKIVAVDIDAKGAADLVAAIEAEGGQSVAVVADLSQTEAAAAAVAKAIAAFGQVDIAINCVGRLVAKPIADVTSDLWDEAMDTELKSCYNLMRPVVEQMSGRGYGRILMLTSRSAGGLAGQAAHAAAKAGVNGFTRALALEVGRQGITVNAISPYYIETASMREQDPQAVERAKRSTAVRRVGTVEDVAATAAFLVSDEASFITGQIISVCGGSNIGLLQW